MSYEVVVIVDKSAGNDTVGEMWRETKTFDSEATLEDVLEWANEHGKRPRITKRHIQLTIPDQSFDAVLFPY